MCNIGTIILTQNPKYACKSRVFKAKFLYQKLGESNSNSNMFICPFFLFFFLITMIAVQDVRTGCP